MLEGSPLTPSSGAAREGDGEGLSTTNPTVSDRWGNVVEHTLTIEQTSGAGIVVPDQGFLLDNELTDWTITHPADPNRLEPGKRPCSSMSPTIVFKDGEPFVPLGSPGGSTIITAVLQMLFNRIDRGMDIEQAWRRVGRGGVARALTAYLGAVPPSYPFLKGHGTENDFVLLPDHDGSVHGELTAERVVALCDRRGGIGGDGVLRVIRSQVADPSQAVDAEWYMDYRNSDGSLSEMCGNGIRLFARHLVDEGLADPRAPIPVATRDGVKLLTVDGDRITADLGSPKVLGETMVGVGDRCWPARHVDMGNPHAVVFVDDLAEAGPLLEPPVHDPAVFPHGVNVEFVARRGERHVAMRVHERGSGETRSCGTGACAAMVGAALADGQSPSDETTYRVDLPGGTLAIAWTGDDRVLLTGPAVVVARGTTSL